MSSITTIDSTDQVSASRADINTNFSNLNADKVESLSDLGITASAAELNYTDGVTSAIQTQLDAKLNIAPRVVSMSDATSFTPTSATADINTQANTQAVGTLTANAPSGSPSNGQKLLLRIKSTNIQTFSWNAIYRGSNTVALPTATTGSSKTDYFGFIYNSADSKWDCIAASYGYT